jgi:hypothetical protein
MKKIILILNHVTAGMGSDEQVQLPPNVIKLRQKNK